MEDDQRQADGSEPHFPPSKVRLIPWPNFKTFFTVMVGRVTYGSFQRYMGKWYTKMHPDFDKLNAADQGVIMGVINDYQNMCDVTARLFS